MTSAQNLQVALVQTALEWESPRENIQVMTQLLDGLDQVDLVLLPEMFTTGFTMFPNRVGGEAGRLGLEFLRDQALKKGSAIAGSTLFEASLGEFVNRFFFVHPNGKVDHYDKRHRFAMAGEHEAYGPGDSKPVIVSLNGWKILLQVCYDLRFPVFSRNYGGQYDAVIYTANWPQTRRIHWQTLLHARAIENQAYVIGVNRIGHDGNDYEFIGDSMVVDPTGDEILYLQDKAEIGIATLEVEHLRAVRQRLPFLKDADKFTLE